MCVLAHVDVTAPGFGTARVEYGDGTSYGRATPAYPLAADATASIPVLGLTPAATSHWRVCLDGGTAPAGCTADQVVVTGSLPPQFPSFAVMTNVEPPSGFVLLGVTSTFVGPIWAVALGPDARVWWYAALGHQVDHAFDFVRSPRGTLLVYRSDDAEFDEVDIEGRSQHLWRVPEMDGANGHAIYPFDADRMLMMSYGHAGDADFDSFDALTRDGQVGFHWQTPDYPMGTDPYHPNSFAFDASGALIASLRNSDTVLALDGQTGAERWRLGGTASSFAFAGDPLGSFSHQHSVTVLADGHVLLFDNGNGHAPPVTRVAEYALDLDTKTATLVWDYRHVPPIFCPAGGSAERLQDGSTLVVWSFGGRVTRVAKDGQVLWELGIDGGGLAYRGRWIADLYP
jgi:hypothetical protein